MIQKEIYTIDQVLQHVIPYNPKEGKHYVDFDGDLMKMESQRYRLFKRDGTHCVICKNQGSFFRKEKHNVKDKTYHFNLYGIIDGKETLFTKDHILPVSKGGKDIMSNYQVMCVICNRDKGNKI